MCHFLLFGCNVTHLFCFFFTLVAESNKKNEKINKIVNSILLVIHMHSMWYFSNSNNHYNMAKIQIHRKNIVSPPRYFLRIHLRLKFIFIKWANISIVISFQHFELLFFFLNIFIKRRNTTMMMITTAFTDAYFYLYAYNGIITIRNNTTNFSCRKFDQTVNHFSSTTVYLIWFSLKNARLGYELWINSYLNLH